MTLEQLRTNRAEASRREKNEVCLRLCIRERKNIAFAQMAGLCGDWMEGITDHFLGNQAVCVAVLLYSCSVPLIIQEWLIHSSEDD